MLFIVDEMKLGEKDGFWAAVPASTIQPNQLTPINLQGTPLLLTRYQGKWIAFSRYCPHASGDFYEGNLIRHKIVCPVHQYSFDLLTGHILHPPDENYRLKRYEVQEQEGMLWVKLNS